MKTNWHVMKVVHIFKAQNALSQTTSIVDMARPGAALFTPKIKMIII